VTDRSREERVSEQRIDTGAEAATGSDADPGEGLGIADPAAHADPLDPLTQRKGDRPPADLRSQRKRRAASSAEER
jgi:hypothetical protein